MRYTFLLILFILLGRPECGRAQTSATATINVSVTIIRNNSINKVQSPRFIHNNRFQAVHANKKGAGRFSIAGQPNSQILLSLPDKINLEDEKGHQLQYKMDTPVFSNKSNPKNSKRFTNRKGGAFKLNNNNGKMYVWLGGNPSTTKEKKGHFKGIYTVNIVYN